MQVLKFILISVFFCTLAHTAQAKGSLRQSTEASACKNCAKKKKALKKISVKKSAKKGKKSTKAHVKGKTKACPLGVGPMNKGRCTGLEKTIAQLLGQKNVACYSSLFYVEGSCSTTIYHDPKKAHNPNVGIGLCALEKSPAVRKRNNRGPNCMNISSLKNQIKCCADIMRKHGSSYFGTVKCKKTPRCS
jgi:hypothetical protein